MRSWEILLEHALVILRSAACAGSFAREWTLGGGTALMLRYGHRRSEDIDIFVPDPQLLAFLTPRLNPVAESLTPDYAEGAGYVKLYFREGQIDFIASPHVTPMPSTRERLIGVEVPLETAAEVIGKKLWHRAHAFTARDLLDLALVATADPGVVAKVEHILEYRADALSRRLDAAEDVLAEQFEALDVLRPAPRYRECLATVRAMLAPLRKRPRVEARAAPYRVTPSGSFLGQPRFSAPLAAWPYAPSAR
jgi:hypothetical protein